MTLPRQYLAGSTYQITRRCTHREFRLLPSPEVNQIVLYCLAYAAQRTDMEIHAVQPMSNHLHVVLTDPHGQLPRYTETAHKLIAKCMNALFGWEENFWSNKKPSVVRLEDPDAILRAIVYGLVNPPASGLVPHATQWPGAHTADMEFGSSLEVERPKVFFRKDGPMPESVTLKLVPPEAFRSMDDASFTDLVRRAVATRERQIQDDLQKNGRRFLGPERCLKFGRLDRPRTEEPRCTLSPTIASTDENVRKAALQRRKQFLADYRDAYDRWRTGDRDVVFPPGTYWLRVYAGVRCREPAG